MTIARIAGKTKAKHVSSVYRHTYTMAHVYFNVQTPPTNSIKLSAKNATPHAKTVQVHSIPNANNVHKTTPKSIQTRATQLVLSVILFAG
jgi:hypothetical protein